MYCPLCKLVVAPFDPEQVKKGDRIFHGKCWDNKKEEIKRVVLPKINRQSFVVINGCK